MASTAMWRWVQGDTVAHDIEGLCADEYASCHILLPTREQLRFESAMFGVEARTPTANVLGGWMHAVVMVTALLA